MAKKKKKQREYLAEYWVPSDDDDDGALAEMSDTMMAQMQRQFSLNAAMMALGVGPWGGQTPAAHEVVSYAAAVDKYLTTGMTVPLDDRMWSKK